MLDKFIDLTKPFQKFLEYPKEYNPRVHGPYNPAQYYGKPDPLSEVKVGEFGQWLGRRNFSLSAIRSALGRAMWKYRLKYIAPKKANAAFIFHFIFFTYTLNYFIYEYPVRKHHTWAIYH
ncbi:ATP synthase subunit mitochondrial [Brachionus plicatilis]|uniref:ATP synthase subunit mitochondrial n=1 Tax=Brachionus plicatilis TaxID=10195 RepID=A0A3M7RNZ4_BRAPC|nr:ATP synthase subunit mitochondrial [Brachionus plicatilis]